MLSLHRNNSVQFADTNDHENSCSDNKILDEGCSQCDSTSDFHDACTPTDCTTVGDSTSPDSPTPVINDAPELQFTWKSNVTTDSEMPAVGDDTVTSSNGYTCTTEHKMVMCSADDIISEGGDSGITDMDSSQTVVDTLSAVSDASRTGEPLNKSHCVMNEQTALISVCESNVAQSGCIGSDINGTLYAQSNNGEQMQKNTNNEFQCNNNLDENEERSKGIIADISSSQTGAVTLSAVLGECKTEDPLNKSDRVVSGTYNDSHQTDVVLLCDLNVAQSCVLISDMNDPLCGEDTETKIQCNDKLGENDNTRPGIRAANHTHNCGKQNTTNNNYMRAFDVSDVDSEVCSLENSHISSTETDNDCTCELEGSVSKQKTYAKTCKTLNENFDSECNKMVNVIYPSDAFETNLPKSDMTVEIDINYSSDTEVGRNTTEESTARNSDTDDADEGEVGTKNVIDTNFRQCANVCRTGSLPHTRQENDVDFPLLPVESLEKTIGNSDTDDANGRKIDTKELVNTDIMPCENVCRTSSLPHVDVPQLPIENIKHETDEGHKPKIVDDSAYNILRTLITDATRRAVPSENDKNDCTVPKSSKKREGISADLVMGLDGSVKLQTGSTPCTGTAPKLTSHRLMVAPDQSSKLQLYMVPNDLTQERDKRAFLVLPPNGTGWEIKPNHAGTNTITPVYTKESSLIQHVANGEHKIVSIPKCILAKNINNNNKSDSTSTDRHTVGNLKTIVTTVTDSFPSNPMKRNRIQPVVNKSDVCTLKSTSSMVPLFNSSFVKNAAQDGVTMSKPSKVQNPAFVPVKNPLNVSRPNNVMLKFAPLNSSGQTNLLKSVLKPMPTLSSKPGSISTVPKNITIKLSVPKKKSKTEYNETEIIQLNGGTNVIYDRYHSFRKAAVDNSKGTEMDITIDTVFSLAPDDTENPVANSNVMKKETITRKSSKKMRKINRCSLQADDDCRVVLSKLKLDATKTVFKVKKLSRFQKDTCTKRCRKSAMLTASESVDRMKENDSDTVDGQSKMTKKTKMACSSRPLSKRIRELPQKNYIPAKRTRSNVVMSGFQCSRSNDLAVTKSSPTLQTTVGLSNRNTPQQSAVVDNIIKFKELQTGHLQTAPEVVPEPLIGFPMVQMPSNMANIKAKQMTRGQAQSTANMFKPMHTRHIQTAPEVVSESIIGNPMVMMPPIMLQNMGISTIMSQSRQSNMPVSGPSNNNCNSQQLLTQLLPQCIRNRSQNNSTVRTMPETPAQKFFLVKAQDKNILIPINSDGIQPRAYVLNSQTSRCFTANDKGALSFDPKLLAIMQEKNITPPVLQRPQISTTAHSLVPEPSRTSPSVRNANPASFQPNQNCANVQRETTMNTAYSGAIAIKPEPVNRGYSDETSISDPTNLPSKNSSLTATPNIKPERLNRGYSDEIPVCGPTVPASNDNSDDSATSIVSETNRKSGMKTEISHAERIRQLKERLKEQRKAVEDLQQQRLQNPPLSLDL